MAINEDIQLSSLKMNELPGIVIDMVEDSFVYDYDISKGSNKYSDADNKDFLSKLSDKIKRKLFVRTDDFYLKLMEDTIKECHIVSLSNIQDELKAGTMKVVEAVFVYETYMFSGMKLTVNNTEKFLVTYLEELNN